MTLVFMLEEASMKALLEGLLPRILPGDVPFILVVHEGKSDLEKSLGRLAESWRIWCRAMARSRAGDGWGPC